MNVKRNMPGARLHPGRLVAVLGLWLMSLTVGFAASKSDGPLVAKWDRFERTFKSIITYANPVQSATLTVSFVSPLGETNKVYGFWDGGVTWRVRFAPNQAGKWTYRTECSEKIDLGLHGIQGSFLCTAPTGKTRFTQHGVLRVSNNHRYLMHDDLTPFFWLADTAWNGPLRSTDDEWAYYLQQRSKQNFTAVQWVAAQWRAAPDGDLKGQLAYSGREKIEVNPAFFQRLDRKVEEMNRAGLLSVPVMLWAIEGGSNPQINPGVSLPEDQAIILARYMLARWGAHHVAWILAGDGEYRGAKAEKWKRIGRAVFGEVHHAPATMHPGGMKWVLDEFLNESWMDICGYQSAHNEKTENLRWITSGPASKDWNRTPVRPFISLEAPYENHFGSDKKTMSADVVRRAHYWSLLNAPTAGITYGGHGIWGWDDGTKPPVDHPYTGTPLSWRSALGMPGAQQMKILADFFTAIDFHRLAPASQVLAMQPGVADPRRFVSAAMTDKRDLMVIYVPEDRSIEVKLDALTAMGSPEPSWFNPRTGEKQPAVALVGNTTCQIPTPAPGDWVLVVTARK